MGYIISQTTTSLEAALTQRARRNFLSDTDERSGRVAYFTIGDSDVHYLLAGAILAATEDNNLPAEGFVPDLTGDYLGCVKSLSPGVDGSALRSFIPWNNARRTVAYGWTATGLSCVTGPSAPGVITGSGRTGGAVYATVGRTVDGVPDSTFSFTVPVGLTDAQAAEYLSDAANTRISLTPEQVSALAGTRRISLTPLCLTDITFDVSASQVSALAGSDNDCFVLVSNIRGGSGTYRASIDNGISYVAVTGSTVRFDGLPQAQTRNVVVGDNQPVPFSTRKPVTTPSNIPPPVVRTATITSLTASPSLLPDTGGAVTLTATLNRAVDADTVIRLSNGGQLVIAALSTGGTATFTASATTTYAIQSTGNPNVTGSATATVTVPAWIDIPGQFVCELSNGSTGPLNVPNALNTQRVLKRQYLQTDSSRTRFVHDPSYVGAASACPLPQPLRLDEFYSQVTGMLQGAQVREVSLRATGGSGLYRYTLLRYPSLSSAPVRTDYMFGTEPFTTGPSVIYRLIPAATPVRYFVAATDESGNFAAAEYITQPFVTSGGGQPGRIFEL